MPILSEQGTWKRTPRTAEKPRKCASLTEEKYQQDLGKITKKCEQEEMPSRKERTCKTR